MSLVSNHPNLNNFKLGILAHLCEWYNAFRGVLVIRVGERFVSDVQ